MLKKVPVPFQRDGGLYKKIFFLILTNNFLKEGFFYVSLYEV
jgi:hypothetical protein